MEENILSQRELRRYQSQINFDGIGLQGQEKIKKSRVLVIGAGGKGTTALKTLLTAGVGFIGISDDNLVQEETLGRQNLYGDNDIGKQKAIVSKQYLKSRNQFAEIKVHNIRLTSENLVRIIEGYDILIDATNNYQSHYAISTAAKLSNKPFVFSAIHSNKAIVTVLDGLNVKTLKDIIPEEREFNIGMPDYQSPEIVINTLTGVVLANETFKIILNFHSQLHSNLLIIDASDYSFTLRPID
jgi:adenylyltransferase/sulfurtransferase